MVKRANWENPGPGKYGDSIHKSPAAFAPAPHSTTSRGRRSGHGHARSCANRARLDSTRQSRFRITALKRKFFTYQCARPAHGATPHPPPETAKQNTGIRGHDTYFPAAREICIVSPHSVSSPQTPPKCRRRRHPDKRPTGGWRCSFSERAKGLRFAPRKSRKKPESERRKRAAPTPPPAHR